MIFNRVLGIVACMVFVTSCSGSRTSSRAPSQGQPYYPQGVGYPQPNATYPGQPNAGYYNPQGPQQPAPSWGGGQPQPVPQQQPSPQPSQPSAPASTPQTSTAGVLAPAPFGSFDAMGAFTATFMRQEAKTVLDELVAALPETSKARVLGIPLMVIEDPSEVNAFAGCNKSGNAFMGITAPLLTIQASSSEAKAFDELYATKHYDKYVTDVANAVKSGKGVVRLAAGVLTLPGAIDPRKLARQKFILDEQLAFVLGHELAHHYRGHTGCANGARNNSAITTEDIGRVLSSTVPLFNQPMEIESDVYGVTDLLDAGARRAGGAWTEEGALMTLNFFSRLTSSGVESVLLGFLRTHPPPALRIPIVQTTAQQWRQRQGSGSKSTPSSPFPFPFPIPGFGG